MEQGNEPGPLLKAVTPAHLHPLGYAGHCSRLHHSSTTRSPIGAKRGGGKRDSLKLFYRVVGRLEQGGGNAAAQMS